VLLLMTWGLFVLMAQHINCAHPTVWHYNLDTERLTKIQSHSRRDEVFEKNHKKHTTWQQKTSQYF
jgi:hypothetical protein